MKPRKNEITFEIAVTKSPAEEHTAITAIAKKD
jgi:hypothetical protein